MIETRLVAYKIVLGASFSSLVKVKIEPTRFGDYQKTRNPLGKR
jgi:hypothetical protein